MWFRWIRIRNTGLNKINILFILILVILLNENDLTLNQQKSRQQKRRVHFCTEIHYRADKTDFLICGSGVGSEKF
jgi:hypothetical protein